MDQQPKSLHRLGAWRPIWWLGITVSKLVFANGGCLRHRTGCESRPSAFISSNYTQSCASCIRSLCSLSIDDPCCLEYPVRARRVGWVRLSEKQALRLQQAQRQYFVIQSPRHRSWGSPSFHNFVLRISPRHRALIGRGLRDGLTKAAGQPWIRSRMRRCQDRVAARRDRRKRTATCESCNH